MVCCGLCVVVVLLVDVCSDKGKLLDSLRCSRAGEVIASGRREREAFTLIEKETLLIKRDRKRETLSIQRDSPHCERERERLIIERDSPH